MATELPDPPPVGTTAPNTAPLPEKPVLSQLISSLQLGSESKSESDSKEVCSSSSSSNTGTFVPPDPHMAKILDLLRVDLDAIDDTKRRKRGRAKVDRDWIYKVTQIKWSRAFDEDGHLRLTRVFHMLPKLINATDADLSLWKSYRRLKSAVLGLADYNKRNQGGEYYLVKPITSHPALSNHEFVSHANFLAKRKDDPESPVELFFAVVNYYYDEVDVCCPLDPRLLPPGTFP